MMVNQDGAVEAINVDQNNDREAGDDINSAISTPCKPTSVDASHRIQMPLQHEPLGWVRQALPMRFWLADLQLEDQPTCARPWADRQDPTDGCEASKGRESARLGVALGHMDCIRWARVTRIKSLAYDCSYLLQYNTASRPQSKGLRVGSDHASGCVVWAAVWVILASLAPVVER